MKKLILFITILMTGTTLMFAQDYKVDFVDDDWNAVVNKAAQEDKFIMVDAYTDWCYWCKVMDEKTFQEPKVATFLNERVVATKINCEKGWGADFSMKFRVSGFPTLLFFNPAGELVGRLVGYEQDNAKFMNNVRDLLQIEDPQPFAFSSKDMDPGFPDFYKASFTRDDNRGARIDPEVADAWLSEQDDLFSEAAFSVMWRSGVRGEFKDHFMSNYDKYTEMYGAELTERMVMSAAYAEARMATEAKDEKILEEAIAMLEPMDQESKEYVENNLRMNFYQSTGEWKKYVGLMEQNMKEEELKDIAGSVNSAAWSMYLECDDQKYLKKATGWMSDLVEIDPQYAYLDTYAALLYKTNQLDEAEIWAEKAIAKGQEDGDKVTGTEELLDKIKEAKSSD